MVQTNECKWNNNKTPRGLTASTEMPFRKQAECVGMHQRLHGQRRAGRGNAEVRKEGPTRTIPLVIARGGTTPLRKTVKKKRAWLKNRYQNELCAELPTGNLRRTRTAVPTPMAAKQNSIWKLKRAEKNFHQESAEKTHKIKEIDRK